MADKTIADFTATTAVASGDLFEMENTSNNSRKITASNLAAGLRTLALSGAKVTKTGNNAGVNATAGYTIPFDSESFDTGSFHDNVTNNTRLTTTSSSTYVFLVGYVSASGLTSGERTRIRILKNGSVFQVHDVEITLTEAKTEITVIDKPATPGTDYYELDITTEADASITVSSESTFAIIVLG